MLLIASIIITAVGYDSPNKWWALVGIVCFILSLGYELYLEETCPIDDL
jgi:hypothetical protein